MRRSTLHSLLVERASELGVTFHWGVRVRGFDKRSVFIDGAHIPCRWLVGADGQNSCVGKWANLNSKRPRISRFGFSRHYGVSRWTDLVEVHWGPGCQMFVTPTADDEVCVAVLSHDPGLRIEPGLAHFPGIAKHLNWARPRTAELGNVTSLGHARGVISGNVALVGDASFSVDGISGLGLTLAFQQAVLVAEAFSREDLTYYEDAHRKISVAPWRMTRLLLLMDQSAWVRRKVLRLLARKPALFSRMMSAHMAQTMNETLHTTEMLGLGWQVLRA